MEKIGSNNKLPATLIILGAGCSVSAGYPSAANMLDQLKAFSDSLGSAAFRLQTIVSQTIELFQKLRAQGSNPQTLDELVWMVHNGKLHNRSIAQEHLEAYRLVTEAKLAVAALFLSKESQALQQGLRGYSELMKRLFSNKYGPDMRTIIQQTPHRVLTFNYDRLFEMAFRQYFTYDGTEA